MPGPRRSRSRNLGAWCSKYRRHGWNGSALHLRMRRPVRWWRIRCQDSRCVVLLVRYRVSRCVHSVFEFLGQCACRCITIFTIFCCSFLYHRVHRWWNSGVSIMKQWYELLQVFHQNAEMRIALEGNSAAEHLKKDNAQFVDVCTAVNLPTPYHLGCHVFGRTENSA